MSINHFAQFGVMANSGLFLQMGLYGPALVTGAAIASKVAQNPQLVKEKILGAKQLVVESFSRKENESSTEFKSRLIKNVVKVFMVMALLSAVGALPFIVLPASFAIPAALIAIGSTVLLMKNGTKWKHQVISAFTPQIGETSQEARKRILKNSAIGVFVAGLAIALGVLGAHWIGMLMSGGIWGFTSIIPQTPVTLFLEYGILGLIHFGLAIKQAMKGNKAQALYHLASGILSFIFPAFYVFFSPPSDLRLHHSFLGLLLQLTPFPGLQFFGSLVTFDSSMYMFSSTRGFMQNGIFRSADFMNIVVDNLPGFVLILTATSVIYQLVKEFLFSKDTDLRCGSSNIELTSFKESSTSLKRLPSSTFN